MSEPIRAAEIESARAYEALMVPSLFGPWAPRVADAGAIERGDRVLDVACGTGVLSRECAARAGASGSVVGLDPAAGMLEVARELEPGIQWQQGTAESLPFPEHCFDVVVSQFGLMFFRDRARALREALRVLVPGGRIVFAVWAELDSAPGYAAEVELLERVAGRRAADAVRMPFVLGDRRELDALFTGAGVGWVDVVLHRGTARFPDLRRMVEADLRGWLPMTGVVLPEDRVAAVLSEAEHALRSFVVDDGAVEFDCSAYLVTGGRDLDPWCLDS